jgi:glycosyltransferase involved in cell wall biosynthesis
MNNIKVNDMKHLLPRITLLQFVPEALPTYRADVAMLFGKYLPRLGVQCHIVGKSGDGEPNNQGFASVRRSYPTADRKRREVSYLWLCLKALWGADKQSCDLIQVRDMVSIGLLALLIARMKGMPFVYWISFLMSEERINRARANIKTGGGFRFRLILLKGLFEKYFLYQIILPNSQHIFVQSEAMKDRLVAQGFSPEKLTAVPMGVDTETLQLGSIAAQRLSGWEGIPLIAYLGTLDGMRLLHEVIDALVKVREQYPDACLLFIGDSLNSEDTEALLTYANRVNLNNAVHITGWLPSREAWALLLGADVAISFVPRSEIYDVSSPTKLLEYLALGMPCVANDIPDQAQVLLDSEAGWLTDSSFQGIAQALTEILDDPKAARIRAASGPMYIDAHRSYRVLAMKVAEQYRRIIE